jgi:GTP cyclohydrolase II
MSPQIVESNDIEKNLKVRCEVRCRIPTADKGEFYVHLYSNNLNNKQHLAIVAGPYIYSKSLNEVRENDTDEKRMIRGATIKPNVTLPIKSVNKNDLEKDIINLKNNNQYINNNINQQSDIKLKIPLVRIHSECFTSETIFSSRCDCAEQLERSMKKIQEYGNGVVVYLRQEGRNIGLLNKMMAYNLQDNGYDTVEANVKLNQPVDGRNYTIAARILEDLQIDTVRLLTNNPDKIEQLTSLGVNVVERIPMIPSIFENISKHNNCHHHTQYLSSDSTSNCSNDLEDDTSTVIEPELVPEEHGKLTELEKYLQTKVEFMRHDIPLPEYLIHTHTK